VKSSIFYSLLCLRFWREVKFDKSFEIRRENRRFTFGEDFEGSNEGSEIIWVTRCYGHKFRLKTEKLVKSGNLVKS